MATPAKKLQESNVLKNADKQNDAPNPTARWIALTPARRDEIIHEIVNEYRETLDILARYDRDGNLTNESSN